MARHRLDSVTDEDISGPKIDRRTTVKLLGASGVSASLVGCLGDEGDTVEDDDDEDEQAAGDGEEGGRLEVGWHVAEVETLDPPYVAVGAVFPLMANIFNGLVMLKPDLTMQGDLAKDWEVTNDGKTFTFELHEGVEFHNGEEFTAEDVEYTINRTISEDTPHAGKFDMLEPVDDGGVEIIDEYTVELNWEDTNAPALVNLTRGPGRAATIVNEEAIEEMGREQYGRTPVGTGPFEVTEHEIGSGMVLDKFDNYFKEDEDGNSLPYIDGIDVDFIPEPGTAVNAIRGGDIDFLDSLPLENIDDIDEGDDVDVLSAPGINWSGVCLNTTREPFSSTKVRQGIAKLVDQEQLVESAFFGYGIPAKGPIHKGTEWAWREDKPDYQDYNPEEGLELLEEADVDEISFSIMANEGNLRVSKVLRDQLTQADIDVEIDQVTGATFSDDLNNGDFDATIIGMWGDPDPELSTWNMFRTDGPWNFNEYENEEVHDLLMEQRNTIDQEERKEVLWEIEDLLMEDAPFAWLSHQDDVAAKAENVQGFTHIPGVRYFEEVWME